MASLVAPSPWVIEDVIQPEQVPGTQVAEVWWRHWQEITMRRRPRVSVEVLVYHVYNRAGRGEAPFELEDEAGRF